MVGPKHALRSAVALGLLITAIAGCRSAQELVPLSSISELEARFDRDAADTRVVLLLTPT